MLLWTLASLAHADTESPVTLTAGGTLSLDWELPLFGDERITREIRLPVALSKELMFATLTVVPGANGLAGDRPVNVDVQPRPGTATGTSRVGAIPFELGAAFPPGTTRFSVVVTGKGLDAPVTVPLEVHARRPVALLLLAVAGGALLQVASALVLPGLDQRERARPALRTLAERVSREKWRADARFRDRRDTIARQIDRLSGWLGVAQDVAARVTALEAQWTEALAELDGRRDVARARADATLPAVEAPWRLPPEVQSHATNVRACAEEVRVCFRRDDVVGAEEALDRLVRVRSTLVSALLGWGTELVKVLRGIGQADAPVASDSALRAALDAARTALEDPAFTGTSTPDTVLRLGERAFLQAQVAAAATDAWLRGEAAGLRVAKRGAPAPVKDVPPEPDADGLPQPTGSIPWFSAALRMMRALHADVGDWVQGEWKDAALALLDEGHPAAAVACALHGPKPKSEAAAGPPPDADRPAGTNPASAPVEAQPGAPAESTIPVLSSPTARLLDGFLGVIVWVVVGYGLSAESFVGTPESVLAAFLLAASANVGLAAAFSRGRELYSAQREAAARAAPPPAPVADRKDAPVADAPADGPPEPPATRNEGEGATEWDLLGGEPGDTPAEEGPKPEAAGRVWQWGDVRWADDADSMDYSHLSGLGIEFSEDPFELTPATLQALCERNAFDVSKEDRVLFALRGCAPVGAPDGNMVTSVRLKEARPDHYHLRCVIGVWRRSTNTLAAFRGSTVPNAALVKDYANKGTPRSNMRTCGLYQMQVGTHVGGSGIPVPGAWLHHGRIPVVRSRLDCTFSRADPLLALDGADNLHCAWSTRRGQAIEFSSAGCMTVYGSFDPKSQRHLDPRDEKGWAAFRTCAGISPTTYTAGVSTSPRDGTLYSLVLLTGREARIVATGGTLPKRLRFGSSHEAVRRLQAHPSFKGVQATGVMDFATVDRLTTWQRDQPFGGRDGILKPGDLGIGW